MILSTPRFKYLTGLAAIFTVLFAALVLSHAGLEVVSRWAESKPGYYLWRSDDHLLLLSPARFQRPAKGRLMIFGASEAAEGFIDKAMEERLPGLKVENMAYDGAMFNDLLMQLRYLETAYGEAAIPSHIVVGISVRYVANFKIPRTRLFKDAIDKYSTARVANMPSGTRVVHKGRLGAAAAWVRFRLHQTERYRYAVEAAGIELAYRLAPEWAKKRNLRGLLAKAKYWARIRSGDDEIRARLMGIRHWQQSRVWKASNDRAMVEREMKTLLDFAHRHHVRLYFVNMPMLAATRSIFAPGVLEDYLETVNATRGDAALLDLGELLPDDEFSDAAHASGKGARHISATAADFIRGQELLPRASQ